MDSPRQCRFFFELKEFEDESGLYRHPILSQVLPSVLHADSNTAGKVVSRSGYAFPPFIVLERGMTLTEWCQQKRGFFEVSRMVESLANLLATLHGAGFVHRDIKPDNVLYLTHSTVWRLLDMGIVERQGTLQRSSGRNAVTHMNCVLIAGCAISFSSYRAPLAFVFR